MNADATGKIDEANGHHAVHGVLLKVFDIGVLLLGESGIGKSEIALELVGKGHQLVADDAVLVSRIGGDLTGKSPELSYEYLEIRGLGILNIRELFGPSSVVRNTKVELCIDLVESELAGRPVDRIGLDTPKLELLDKAVPRFVIPVKSGRNLATIVETAVRLFIARRSGSDAVQKLIEKHSSLVGLI